MSILGGLLRRRPEHCRSCGDEFVEATYREGFRTTDGSPIVKRWWKCPRSDDHHPSSWERYQVGRCGGLSPLACAVETAAFLDHRPQRGACGHHSVTEWGESCYAKDGTPITQDRRLVQVVA